MTSATIVLTLALLLSVEAQAKLVVAVEPQRRVVNPDDLAMPTAPLGASLERDYFNALQATLMRGLPCLLQQSIFEKKRLAQSCN